MAGCSQEPALPQDESFAACLERAGLSMPAEDAAEEEVSGFMQDPQAVGCAVDELDTESLQAWMRAGFEESGTGPLMETLKEYVASSDRGGLKLAQETGTLVGVMDQDSDEWNPRVYESVMAWEIYKAAEGEPPGFEAWSARSPSRSGAEAIVVYLGELGGSPAGSAEHEAWIEINELQSEVSKAREAAAG
jgi:hypothetical protein